MSLDRRTFLAGAPLVFGLDRLLAQDVAADPLWYEDARRRMKDTGRNGVVLLVDPEHKNFAEALTTCLESPAAGEILGQSVFITMLRPLAKGRLLADGESFNRLLLDPDGRRLASDRIRPEDVASPSAFVASFRPFVEGVDGSRLRERAVADPAAEELLADLDAEDPETRNAASATLTRRADRLFPWLLWTSRRPGSAERRSRLSAILRNFLDSVDPTVPGHRLPFGAILEIRRVQVHPRIDPCPECGRGSVSISSRRFLKFMVK